MDIFNRKLVKKLKVHIGLLEAECKNNEELKKWLIEQEQLWKNKYERAIDDICMMDDEIEQVAIRKYHDKIIQFTVDNIDDTAIKGIGYGDVITAKISAINVNRGIIKFLSRKYNIKSNGEVTEHNGDAVVVLKATLSHASRLISIKKSNKSNIG